MLAEVGRIDGSLDVARHHTVRPCALPRCLPAQYFRASQHLMSLWVPNNTYIQRGRATARLPIVTAVYIKEMTM